MSLQQWTRRIGCTLLVVLTAFLVLGPATADAVENTRTVAVGAANDFVAACFAAGGDPDVLVADDNKIIVYCDLPNGLDESCVWQAPAWIKTCVTEPVASPGGDLPDLHPVDPSDLQPIDPNAAPLARANRYQVAEDRVLQRGPARGVLANDADPEGGALSVRLVTGPRKGKLVLRSDGSFVYRPRRNVHGTDRFTYEVRDGLGGSATATVTIKVTARPR